MGKLDLLLSLEANLCANNNSAQGTHEFKGHLELPQLTGQQVEAFHLDKVGTYTIATALEVLIKNLGG